MPASFMRVGNTSGTSVTAAGNRFVGAFGGGGMGNTATEASGAIPWPENGTFSKLSMTVLGNNITGAYNKNTRFRKNLANGNQVVTATLGTLGVVTDNSNTDFVVTGDQVGAQVQPGSGSGGGGVTYTTIGCSYDSADFPTLCVNMLGAGADLATNLNFGEVRTTPPWGSLRWTGVPNDANVLDIRGYSPIISSLTVSVLTNGLSGGTPTTNLRSWISGALGNQSVSIAAGATGFFQDLTNTDYVKMPDKVAVYAENGANAGAIAIRVAAMRYRDITGFQVCAGNDNNAGAGGIAVAAGATVFTTLYGTYNNPSAATESGLSTPPNVSLLTARNMQVYLSANTLTGGLTARFRRAGADGNQVIVVSAGQTGLFEDLSNTDSVGPTEACNYSFTGGAGTGTATVRKTTTTWTQPNRSRNRCYVS